MYCETTANPSYSIPDFEALSALCKEAVLPLFVDNTFGMCGYTCRPFKFGADVIVESATKWIGGHGNTIGGVLERPRFPHLVGEEEDIVDVLNRGRPPGRDGVEVPSEPDRARQDGLLAAQTARHLDQRRRSTPPALISIMES